MTNIHPTSSSTALLGIDLSKYSRLAQFLITSTAVLIFHVTQAYIQVCETTPALASLTPSLHCIGTDIAIEALASLPNLFHARTVRMFRTLGLCRTVSLTTVDSAAQVGFSCPDSPIVIRLGYLGHR
jgi:hypothetical protein